MRTFRTLTIIAAAALMSLSLNAQTVRDYLREDPSRAGNILHNYEAPAVIKDTPAPKGYKPFYVTHYGRHGSRYHTSIRNFNGAVTALDSLHKLGLLNQQGEQLRREIAAIREAHVDMDGILTQKGSVQHQEIATRLYNRCPEIFNQKDRKDIVCVSSTVQRCIQSMANFATALKGKSSDLNISYYTGERFMSYIIKSVRGGANFQERREILGRIRDEHIHPERFLAAITTNPDEAVKNLVRNDAKGFMTQVFSSGIIAQCLDEDLPDITKYFTEDEIYGLWYNDNAGIMDNFGITIENQGDKKEIGQAILGDMLEKIDEALTPGSHKAGDFRFGHDTGLTPFLSLLQVEHYKHTHIADIGDNWYGFRDMPMGSNFQLIFYRSKKSDELLVKMLRNEIETTIPAVPTFDGPYYKWSDLRPYFDQLMKQ